MRDAKALGLMPSSHSTFSESLYMAPSGWSLEAQGYRQCSLSTPAGYRHPTEGIPNEVNATGRAGGCQASVALQRCIGRRQPAALWLLRRLRKEMCAASPIRGGQSVQGVPAGSSCHGWWKIKGSEVLRSTPRSDAFHGPGLTTDGLGSDLSPSIALDVYGTS